MQVALMLLGFLGVTIGTTDLPDWFEIEPQHQRPFLNHPVPGTKRIAIIGSGIAGATAAYTLKKEYENLQRLEIVVFEQSPQVGGLINSTTLGGGNRHTEHADFVDTGGSLIREEDFCMQEAIDYMGLWQDVVEIPTHESPELESNVYVGVWEKGQMILQQEWDLQPRTQGAYVKYLWKYGWSVYKLDTLVQEKLALLRSLYAGSDANLDIKEAIKEVGLEEESTSAADEYFKRVGISALYVQEVIEPTVRFMFGRNLSSINALSALVAMDSKPWFRINNKPLGTVELVDRLLEWSEAKIKLNSRVTRIEQSASGGYLLSTVDQGTDAVSPDELHRAFDTVVVATPQSDIKFDNGLRLDETPAEPTAISTHITYFTTLLHVQLSPRIFNLTNMLEIPNVIYTTNDQKDDFLLIEQSEVYATLPGSNARGKQRLFKVVSIHEVGDEIIAELLGHPSNTSLERMHVHWIHRHVWPTYLVDEVRGPRVDNLQLAPGLFYTGVAGELLPTMEMSCRVAKQITRAIVQPK